MDNDPLVLFLPRDLLAQSLQNNIKLVSEALTQRCDFFGSRTFTLRNQKFGINFDSEISRVDCIRSS